MSFIKPKVNALGVGRRSLEETRRSYSLSALFLC
jgi:hypothetical protein